MPSIQPCFYGTVKRLVVSGDEGSIGSFKKRFSETTAPREEPQEEKGKKFHVGFALTAWLRLMLTYLFLDGGFILVIHHL